MTQRKQGLLPVEAYTSQAWFDWEQEELFGRTWNFAGMTSDLKGPGDYLTVQAGVHPIFVVRGQDHRLRAFHNICRHRGTQLLRAGRESRSSARTTTGLTRLTAGSSPSPTRPRSTATSRFPRTISVFTGLASRLGRRWSLSTPSQIPDPSWTGWQRSPSTSGRTGRRGSGSMAGLECSMP